MTDLNYDYDIDYEIHDALGLTERDAELLLNPERERMITSATIKQGQMTERIRYQNTNGPIVIKDVVQSIGPKPVGLWYSVGTEWRDWCESESFYLERLSISYSLTINLDRILRITTVSELMAFTRRFEMPSCRGWDVDWPLVATLWDGIEIAPYQWRCRLEPDTSWYSGWDVASGCLWGQVLEQYEVIV